MCDPTLIATHCSACARRLSLKCWRPSPWWRSRRSPRSEGAGAEAATAAQGDWLASRPVRRPRGSVCTRLACASLACSLEPPYGEPPGSSLFLHLLACLAYFNVYIVCHIIAVKASMSENGGVWFTLGVPPARLVHVSCALGPFPSLHDML